MQIEPKTTKAENISEANRWLQKALDAENDGKSAKMIDLCLAKACAFEDAAFV